MNPHALAGTLGRIQTKIDQATKNAARINPPRRQTSRNGKKLRRVKYWFRTCFQWQDRNVKTLAPNS